MVVDDHCVLIDTGLTPWIRFALIRRMRHLGLPPQSLKAIFLTHGHLDHTGNVDWIQRWSGAEVYIHSEDEKHLKGEYPYTAISRVCGWLERIGRFVLRYRPPTLVSFFKDHDPLPYISGWRVMHLPGHTHGHCGFYHEQSRLLFSGDLFATYLRNTHPPYRILNTSEPILAESCRKVAALNPDAMIPNHYDFLNPVRIRHEFIKMVERRFRIRKKL
jgi:glyoxylase-like metal-dependent hydrolase (beta-lactamase superfamily II)